MAIQLQLSSFAHLESMVSKPTWKDILLDLISSNSIDPWNIDLVDLSDAFITKVREMEKMDFVIQANVILAASILLKYKSDYLKFLSYQAELAEFPAAEEESAPLEEIPALSLSARIPPRRQITAEELINEMERIIQYDVERVRIPRGAIVETIDLELNDHDIENDLGKILERIKENTDCQGWSLFSHLTNGDGIRATVYTLMCVLYLVQRGSIDIKQDKMFGEIFIHMKKEN